MMKLQNDNQDRTKVLLLGDFRYTPIYARSIARRNLSVSVAHGSRAEFASRSKHVDEVIKCPSVDSGEFGVWLKGATEADRSIRAIIGLGDLQAQQLAEAAADVPDHVSCIVPPWPSVRTCTEKIEMCHLVDSLGIPQAPYLVSTTLGEAAAATTDVGFPCVVKPGRPLGGSFYEKAVILNGPDDVERLAAWDQALVGPFLVQRFVSGRRYNVQFLAHRGTLVDRLVTQTLRTDRHDDTGYTVESVSVTPSEMMDRAAVDLAEALDYSGFGCLQFFGHADTEDISFLEINPRLGGAFAVAERCGVDLPGLAVDIWVHGKSSESRMSDYPAGKRMVWTGGDVLGIRSSLASGKIGRGEAARWALRAARGFVSADIHPTLSKDDPLLALRYYGRALKRFSPRNLVGRAKKRATAS